MTLIIRSFAATDEAAVVALWRAAELTRPWNDPHADIARKQTVQPELFLASMIGACPGANPALAPIQRASPALSVPLAAACHSVALAAALHWSHAKGPHNEKACHLHQETRALHEV